MARRRRNNRKRTYRTRTYTRPIHRMRSAVRISKGVSRRTAYTPSYSSLPKRNTIIQTVTKGSSNASVSSKKHKLYTPQGRVFSSVSDKTLICARRKQRKQIMHAMKHAGKGGQRRPTNNKHRKVKC